MVEKGIPVKGIVALDALIAAGPVIRMILNRSD
jgi:hypothetical protein